MTRTTVGYGLIRWVIRVHGYKHLPATSKFTRDREMETVEKWDREEGLRPILQVREDN